jgi:quercetin dioxygenase-like cupin family protein
MSAFGPKQTWAIALQMSAFGGKADINGLTPLSTLRSGLVRINIVHRKNWEPCMATVRTWIAAVAAVAFVSMATAQNDLNPKNRQELKRENVAGTNMETIISVVEAQPGELLARHIHHGEEAFYVLQGATLETPDGKQIKLPTGAAAINHRNVPHAGFKVIGDTALKYLAVHVVDKGVPLYDAPPK